MTNINQPYRQLNIDVSSAIRKDFSLQHLGTGERTWVWAFNENDISKMFNLGWLEYVKKLNIHPSLGLIFYRPGITEYNDPPHIDGTTGNKLIPRTYGINWILDLDIVYGKEKNPCPDYLDEADMVWFSNNYDRAFANSKNQASPDRPTPYITSEYIHSEKTEIARVKLQTGVFLVQTNVPHNIENLIDRPRLSITLRNTAIDNNKLDWQEIVEFYKDLIID